jgi:hypothetical protein
MPLDDYHNNNHNTSIDAENEKDDIVVDLEKVEPLNDINCRHFFVKDSDTIGDYQAWKCKQCRRGTFLPKGTQIINS